MPPPRFEPSTFGLLRQHTIPYTTESCLGEYIAWAIYVRPRHWLASQMALNLFYKPLAKPPAVEASREAKLNYLKSLENLEALLGALFLYFKPLRSLLLIKASLVTLTIYLKPPGKPQVFKGFPSDFNHLFEAPSEAMGKISKFLSLEASLEALNVL